MEKKNGKVILITGASSGFGRETAQMLHRSGYTVYGTSRKKGTGDFPWNMLALDITDEESAVSAVQTVMEREGRIDVLINNAGIILAGSVEETSGKDFELQFNTNIMGLQRMCRLVIPHMRNEKSGLIINIGSLAGLVGIPFQGAYSASKYAVEGLSESMRMELIPFGINTVLIEPGDFSTEISDHRIMSVTSGDSSPYGEIFTDAVRVMDTEERNGPPPSVLARKILKIIEMKNPRFRYTEGAFFQRVTPWLKKVLPFRIFSYFVMKYYKIL